MLLPGTWWPGANPVPVTVHSAPARRQPVQDRWHMTSRGSVGGARVLARIQRLQVFLDPVEHNQRVFEFGVLDARGGLLGPVARVPLHFAAIVRGSRGGRVCKYV